MAEWIQQFHLLQWVHSIGYVGIALVVFLEMGVFFCFFLPGDSLVMTAGILAAKGVFEIQWLIAIFVFFSIGGYLFGYWFGERMGGWLMKRKPSFWFRPEYIEKAHDFYAKHGGKAVIFGRMVPIVRTFVPIAAGMGKMNYRLFVCFSVLGGLLWGGGICLLAYYLGALIPNITHLFLPIVLFVIFLSISPGIYHYWKSRLKK